MFHQYNRTFGDLRATVQCVSFLSVVEAKFTVRSDYYGRSTEFEELTVSYKYKSEKLEDCEKALEELGGHLYESKLKVVELKEELLPLSEAEWEKDANVANCKGCNLQFSMSKRKHHCRNCGSIFCNSCTDARVKLPSNAKPVRVCLHCYNLLRSRHNSTLEENPT
ncbi:unnamed protein product [Gongylonema pulchrum]|uniref:FYVE-type domain-containing protein n=1 Tax=Gongylonema pulchrum TaxID=637853 RepID=A0A183DVI8_9BILA|nr:unnamed protein product [Gongylonema pulchrum]